MSGRRGNIINAALQAFIDGATSLVPAQDLDSFHKRLAAFQNLAVRTMQKNDYDDFFGWMNPDSFDVAGNVKSRP